MAAVRVRSAQEWDSRRWHRVRLGVPVQVSRGTAAQGQRASPWTGLSKDLSPGGVYLTTRKGGSFVPGDIVTVSITVPWEARGVFPFSRIVGPCRVARTEDVSTDQGKQHGLALTFCEDRITLLGAIITP